MEEFKVKIKCEDGFELSGILFKPEKIRSSVMIAPATGIKKEFYSAFALFLAENGFATLTYDNRGIGESKGNSINSSNASLTNWGKLDMTAVLEYLKNKIPDTDCHLIGISL